MYHPFPLLNVSIYLWFLSSLPRISRIECTTSYQGIWGGVGRGWEGWWCGRQASYGLMFLFLLYVETSLYLFDKYLKKNKFSFTVFFSCLFSFLVCFPENRADPVYLVISYQHSCCNLVSSWVIYLTPYLSISLSVHNFIKTAWKNVYLVQCGMNLSDSLSQLSCGKGPLEGGEKIRS